MLSAPDTRPSVQRTVEHSLAGVTIPDDPAVLSPAIVAAIRSGRFEAAEAAELPHIVRPGDRVLELGAGIGFISTLLDRLPEVRDVLSVEANPYLIPYMARLHAANGVRKVTRMNAVLGDWLTPRASFYLRRDFWMSSLSPGPAPYIAEVEVPVLPMSRLLRDRQISLIVCDIEGAETSLFAGADLAEVDRIYLELHDHLTGLGAVRDLFAVLAAAGFAYDPRHSNRAVVLFQRARHGDPLRAYVG